MAQIFDTRDGKKLLLDSVKVMVAAASQTDDDRLEFQFLHEGQSKTLIVELFHE